VLKNTVGSIGIIGRVNKEIGRRVGVGETTVAKVETILQKLLQIRSKSLGVAVQRYTKFITIS
jgi:hypothetical protein